MNTSRPMLIINRQFGLGAATLFQKYIIKRNAPCGFALFPSSCCLSSLLRLFRQLFLKCLRIPAVEYSTVLYRQYTWFYSQQEKHTTA